MPDWVINVSIIVLLAIFALLVMFFIPQWRVKRALPRVIRTFREHSAIEARHAKTVDELGLRPRGLLQQLIHGRDYKKYALTYLMNADIVQQTEDGKLYLSEDKLAESGISRGTSYAR